MKNIFIIGARGYTKNYGGWETFIQGLLDNWKDSSVKFYVFEIENTETHENIETVNNVTCIRLFVPNIGGRTMMRYDSKATSYAIDYVKKNKLNNVIFYFLGLRIGPQVFLMRHRIKKLGITIVENAAGLEWKRTKWNKLVQIYLWISAFFMAHASDYLVCDSEGILTAYDSFIKTKRPIKTFIPYGTYELPTLNPVFPQKVDEYFSLHSITPYRYYLDISRLVPENSYSIIVTEFMKSTTDCDLVLVNNFEKETNYFNKLKSTTNFQVDKRIKFVGTVYDKDILNYLRKYSRGYINGHTLGGTNPGLLEALSSADVTLAYDVVFSRQVAADTAIYFDSSNPLSKQISLCDSMSNEERFQIGNNAKDRMKKLYSWQRIVHLYEKLFNEIY